MRKLSSMIKVATATLSIIGLSAMALVSPVEAKLDCSGANCAEIGANSVGEGQVEDVEATVNTIINVVIYVVGFVAVAMIVLGGVSYSTSQGDSGKVKKAKDTILYGIIGVVVAILAYAIVNFVLGGIFGQ